jgi:drug/metabolite transporter (DMT)-like permease
MFCYQLTPFKKYFSVGFRKGDLYMNAIMLATAGGTLFAAWQLLARTNSMSPMATNLGMIFGALVTSLAYGSYAMKQSEWSSLTSTNIWLPLVCGVLNGAGFILYLMSMQKSPNLTAVSMTSMMTMIGLIALGSVVLFGEPITKEKFFGIIASVIAVYLLSK